MSRSRGFSVTEVIVVLAVLVVVAAIGVVLFGSRSRRAHPNSQVCAANLNGLFKAMYTYSVSNGDWFPVAGTTDSAIDAQGFRAPSLAGRAGVMPSDVGLQNNVTASLFTMVRDGSTGTKSWICPSTSDVKDPLTDDGTQSGNFLPLTNRWDFFADANLSYSPINMYHAAVGDRWTTNVAPDFIIMGDNNNASGPGVHTPAATPAADNSSSHKGDGQNVLFGDGHVEFVTDPDRGPAGDDIHAMTVKGDDAPPTLGLNDGDAATSAAVADTDVVLIPLTGNNGVSLSGKRAP